MGAMEIERVRPDGLVTYIRAHVPADRRFLFGIAGPPGSGKSTIAAELGRMLGAPVVAMDGFHLPNTVLDSRALRAVKGAPHTFDAEGFVATVASLRRGTGDVVAPAFDRHDDEPVPDALCVAATERIVIVEGNYLLLDRTPWRRLPELLDAVAYVEIDTATRLERLIARHVEFGRTREEAIAFVHRSDEANTARIEASRERADMIVLGA